jgi:hypothetical protein
MLGNIKFVGNLLVQKMLSSKIIFQCSEQLLEGKTDETLETLAVFLTAIGPMFDNKQWPRYDMLCGVFDRVKMLVKDKNSGVSQRIKCLLKDVLDARASNWQGRNKKNEPEGPMKMSEVARQARRDEAGHGQGGGFKPDRNGQGGPSRREEPRVQVGDDEWSHVNTRKPTNVSAWKRPAADTSSAAPQSSASTFGAFGALSKKAAPRTREEEAAKLAKKEAKKAKEAAEAAREKPTGSKDLDEWSSCLSGALTELYASQDLDEAVERLDGLAPAHYDAAFTTFMWAAVESKSERRKHAFQLLAALYERVFGADTLVSTLDAFFEEEGGFDDMSMDVPNIVSILKDEAFPALQEVLGDEYSRFLKGLEGK